MGGGVGTRRCLPRPMELFGQLLSAVIVRVVR
ncbi:hypothetical protein JOD64_002700 [Micromonospora luteifusca]|uniref:Uncharacterized protein n=1 Tax=Micromonospora luteifusca TaxID=709860 RepID=A0ABS2LTI1_9ACTN|nr:hypothetical protein [Micromonospora luteifusca]